MSPRARTIREVEIKLRIADLAALLKQIRQLGAVSHGRVLEQNILYDTPELDFRLRRRLLRLRIETPAPNSAAGDEIHPRHRKLPRAILTSKTPIDVAGRHGYEEKLETETSIANPDAWRRNAGSLGLREGFRYEKYRTSFRVNGAHLDLDETPVGVFLEIEGAPVVIDRIARRLGFSPQDYMRATYWDLYAADCHRRGRKPTNMSFRT